MCSGDITKRDDIIWSYTIEEAKPYIDYKVRDYLLREAQLSQLGIKDTSGKEFECNSVQKEKCTVLYGDNIEWTCKTCKELKK